MSNLTVPEPRAGTDGKAPVQGPPLTRTNVFSSRVSAARGPQAGGRGDGISGDRPRWVPLKARNLTIREGGSEARLGDAVRISSHCFEGFDCKFVLHKPPQHGHVEKSHFPGVKLMNSPGSEDQRSADISDYLNTRTLSICYLDSLAPGGQGLGGRRSQPHARPRATA